MTPPRYAPKFGQLRGFADQNNSDADLNVTLNELKALSNIIQESIAKIEAICTSQNQKFPSLHEPFSPQSEAARNIPEILEASSYAASAAAQLFASLSSPHLHVVRLTLQFHIPTAFHIAVGSHAAEILRDVGAKGMHIRDIAKPTRTDPAKLARVLRLLATYHVFIETSPDVFANNRISSVLDSGKSVDDLVAHPERMHDGSKGLGSIVGTFGDEGFKSSAALYDVVMDPKTSFLNGPNQTAFNKAFGTDLTCFEWYQTEEQESRRRRFNLAMHASQAAVAPKDILNGFDWTGLKEGSVVVDVGGGIGSQTMILVERCPQLVYVVQDRKEVIADAPRLWNAQKLKPGTLDRVRFQAHDFFDPQPIKDAAVFILRMILHDWPDSHVFKILRQLREAAQSTTRLVIVDNILPYACPDEPVKDVPGAERPSPPAPLLPNLGEVGGVSYLTDLQMLTLLNGKERTLSHIRDVLHQSGWKLQEVSNGDRFVITHQKVIAVPA